MNVMRHSRVHAGLRERGVAQNWAKILKVHYVQIVDVLLEEFEAQWKFRTNPGEEEPKPQY